MINEELFTHPLYEEASYIFDKIKDRGLEFDKDILEVLEDVETNAKKALLYNAIKV